MRQIIYILLSIIVLLYSCRQEKDYTITGNLDNSSDTHVFFVIDGQNKIDTIPCEDGHFVIKGCVDSLSYATIFIPEAGIWYDVWVDEKDRLVLTGDIKYPNLIGIKGNATNDKLAAFKSENQSLLREKMDLYYQQQELVADSLDSASNEANYTAKISNLVFQIEEKAGLFVKNNPSSQASIILIRDYLVDPEDLSKMEAYLSALEYPVINSSIYNQLTVLLTRLKRTQVGANAPDFQIVDTKGDTITLADFKGKYLLLTFAASWCDICRRDNIELVEAHKKFHKKGLQMFTVSFDENKDEWTAATKEDKITWLQAIDTQGWGAEMLTIYNISTIPSNVLIDKDGIIIARNLFGDNLYDVLAEHIE